MPKKHSVYPVGVRHASFLVFLALSASAVTAFSFDVKHSWSHAKPFQKQQLQHTNYQQKLKPLLVSSSSSSAEQNNHNLRGGNAIARKLPSAIVQIYGTYMKALDRKPLITKSITTAFISALGDRFAQSIEANTAGTTLVLNWVRLATFFIAGGTFVGPFVHTWYEQLWKLGRWMEKNFGSSKKLQAVVQVVTDQTIGVAIFFPTYFYMYEIIEAAISMRVPEFHMATAKCREQIGSVLLLQYYVWPLTNWINFAYVPESLRVLASDIVAVIFNAYLCTLVA